MHFHMIKALQYLHICVGCRQARHHNVLNAKVFNRKYIDSIDIGYVFYRDDDQESF